MNKQFKIYVSHPIRGKKGTEATIEDQMKWINLMRGQGRKLKVNFPEVEWYIPADHDEALQIAMAKGLLTVDDVLEIDGEILRTCDAIVYFDLEGDFSEGMLYEKKIAEEMKLRSKVLRDPNERDAKISALVEKLKNLRTIAERDKKKAEMNKVLTSGNEAMKAAAKTVVGEDDE